MYAKLMYSIASTSCSCCIFSQIVFRRLFRFFDIILYRIHRYAELFNSDLYASYVWSPATHFWFIFFRASFRAFMHFSYDRMPFPFCQVILYLFLVINRNIPHFLHIYRIYLLFFISFYLIYTIHFLTLFIFYHTYWHIFQRIQQKSSPVFTGLHF